MIAIQQNKNLVSKQRKISSVQAERDLSDTPCPAPTPCTVARTNTYVREVEPAEMHSIVFQGGFRITFQMDDTEVENYSESSSENILGFPCFSMLPVWD